MIRFQTILWIIYFLVSFGAYPYLKAVYFPHHPSKFEKLVMAVLAVLWLVSVPITYVLREDHEGEEL